MSQVRQCAGVRRQWQRAEGGRPRLADDLEFLGQRQKMMAVPTVLIVYGTIYIYKRYLASAATAQAQAQALALAQAQAVHLATELNRERLLLRTIAGQLPGGAGLRREGDTGPE